jgi:hypothetical protein
MEAMLAGLEPLNPDQSWKLVPSIMVDLGNEQRRLFEEVPTLEWLRCHKSAKTSFIRIFAAAKTHRGWRALG